MIKIQRCIIYLLRGKKLYQIKFHSLFMYIYRDDKMKLCIADSVFSPKEPS